MRVMITGATGFIGSHIVRDLCKNNLEIGCVVRKSSKISNLETLPVEILDADIRDRSGIENALKGYDFVIHNAAFVHDWGKYDEFFNTNVEGTMNVFKACKKTGIKDIIMTGTCSIFGEENCLKVKDEEYPLDSHYDYFLDKVFPCKMNYYRDTKTIAVKWAMQYAKENDINLTILNPVWVFGEREFNTGFFEYVKTAKSGMPFMPGTKKNKFHTVYAKDLARAYRLALEKRLEGVNSIIIGNKEVNSMEKIYSLFCKEAGLKKPFNIPKALAYPVGFMIELLYTILNIKKTPFLTRGRVNMLYDNIEYSTKKAEELLGFTNEFSLDQAISETIKWYKEMKLL